MSATDPARPIAYARGGHYEPDHPRSWGGRAARDVFELFFDLVYVLLSLSCRPICTRTSAGRARPETTLMLVAWAWNYTTWMTNRFDPDTAPDRLVLVFVMGQAC